MGCFAALLALLAGSVDPSPAHASSAEVDCAKRMAEHANAWRALPPGTATALRSAIRGGSPPLYLWEGQLVCDEIDAIFCTEEEGAGTCAHVLLTDPDRGCAGERAGPYCAVWEEGLAPSDLRAPILARLEDRAPRDVWRPVDRSAASGETTASAAPSRSLWPVLVGTLALILLIVLGERLGRIAQVPRAVTVGAPLATAMILALLWPDISTWDLLAAGLVVSVSAWAASRGDAWTPRTWARLGIVTAATVLVAELGAQLLLGPPPAVPPPQQARLIFSPEARETACRALFPETYPDARPARPEETKRVVLHLGDSMVFGTGVDRADRFTDRLDRASPDTLHLNAGFPGTGPDHHLAVLRAWLPDLRPEAVVLYLYPGNDLVDLDRAYACCDHGPLLDDAFASNCPSPDWAFPVGALLARSPPPYLLRTAASHLGIAAHLNAAFTRVTSTLEPRLGDAAGTPEAEAAWSRYAGALAAIRELAAHHGVTLTAVLLPTRVVLEPGAAPSHAAGVGDRMADLVAQESIRLLDARPLIERRAQGGSYAHLFGDGVTWDEHLSPEGHGLLSAWLLDRL